MNETIVSNLPPTLTCIEDVILIVGCSIRSEYEAEQKVKGLLNYLQEQKVIKEYNANRLDYLFGNDEPY